MNVLAHTSAAERSERAIGIIRASKDHPVGRVYVAHETLKEIAADADQLRGAVSLSDDEKRRLLEALAAVRGDDPDGGWFELVRKLTLARRGGQ